MFLVDVEFINEINKMSENELKSLANREDIDISNMTLPDMRKTLRENTYN